jgi:predicted nucleic acid-binding protein
MILLDANILVRMCRASDAAQQLTKRVVFAHRRTDSLVVCPQSLYEFWAVATRPAANNGLEMDTATVRQWTIFYSKLFTMVSEPSGLFGAWIDLVAAYDVHGFRSHDARYVALMQQMGIEKLMTFNVHHFRAFPITVIEPT